MNNICPVCGSDKVEKITTIHTISEPFGGTKNISISEVKCNACGSTGDFFNENDISENVMSYRAGSYSIEPFYLIREILKQNGINIDSSICPGMHSDNAIKYDFRSYSDWESYSFEDSPKINEKNGFFTEIPIKTYKLSLLINLYFYI